MSSLAAAVVPVAHCPRRSSSTQQHIQGSCAQPKRSQSSSSSSPFLSFCKRSSSRRPSLRVTAMAASTATKSVSGTMAELKKQGRCVHTPAPHRR